MRLTAHHRAASKTPKSNAFKQSQKLGHFHFTNQIKKTVNGASPFKYWNG
jgi:hypothetical protein